MARTWRLRNELWRLPEQGALMGILNVTPDSFSDGGRFVAPEAALAHARQLVAEGADVLDIGGESTRPGALEVGEEEELRRVVPVLSALRDEFPALRISIDTRHPRVAAAALDAGADIVNDVTALAHPDMRALCAERPCGVILMHMQGEPRTMQRDPRYRDIVAEVRDYLAARVDAAEQAGISPDRLCLDPGIGFGKTTAHNLALIRRLDALRVRDLPILMALSRKRFLGEILGDAGAGKASPLPTVVMSLLAADHGADLHRVHDVAPLRDALALRAAAARAE